MNTFSARHRGFSLIEVLVGLIIGMLAIIIVMQVFALSEGTKRTTTGNADATTNAVTALYLLERDIKLAGWGLDATLYLGRPSGTGTVTPAIPGCTTINAYCSGHTSCGGTTGDIANFSLASVFIQNGADGGPDTLSVRFFSDPDLANQVSNAPTRVFENKVVGNAPQLSVGSKYGCRVGDLILVSDPTTNNSTCSILQLSATPGDPTAPAITPFTLPHQSKAADAADANLGAFNKPSWDAATEGAPLTLAGNTTAFATCFTPAPASGPLFRRTYSVDTAKGELQLTDNTAKTTSIVSGAVTTTYTPIVNQAIASGIVDLQAQYGLSVDGSATESSQQVLSGNWRDADENWNNPIPKLGATDGTTITANRLQNIKAVRVALVARSSQYEKPGADGVCNATPANAGHIRDADHPEGWSTWATFNTANYPQDWRCYRYRAFELIIPLRNILWANV